MNTLITFIKYNSYWYLTPLLIFNSIFTPKLTEAGYLTKQIDIGLLGTVEFILRIAIFLFPLMIQMDYSNPKFSKFITLFVIGHLLYFASWFMIIYLPHINVTTSWWIQLAPAYLPLIFLIALALMGKKSNWYIPLSTVFVIVHTLSTYLKLKG